MKKTSLKDTSITELLKTLAEKREELRALRFAAAGSRPKDTDGPAKARKTIARLLTELSVRAKAK